MESAEEYYAGGERWGAAAYWADAARRVKCQYGPEMQLDVVLHRHKVRSDAGTHGDCKEVRWVRATADRLGAAAPGWTRHSGC